MGPAPRWTARSWRLWPGIKAGQRGGTAGGMLQSGSSRSTSTGGSDRWKARSFSRAASISSLLRPLRGGMAACRSCSLARSRRPLDVYGPPEFYTSASLARHASSWESGSHRDRRRFLGLDRLLPWGQHPRAGAPRWAARRHVDRDRRPDPGGGGAGLPAREGWGHGTTAPPRQPVSSTSLPSSSSVSPTC
jgi:hypothetical protein